MEKFPAVSVPLPVRRHPRLTQTTFRAGENYSTLPEDSAVQIRDDAKHISPSINSGYNPQWPGVAWLREPQAALAFERQKYAVPNSCLRWKPVDDILCNQPAPFRRVVSQRFPAPHVRHASAKEGLSTLPARWLLVSLGRELLSTREHPRGWLIKPGRK